jgi:accessory colonization factor AcfC
MSNNPEDLSDCTKEEIEQVKAFEECLKQYKKPSKTKIEKVLDFDTDLDKWVWDRLPLSNAQKEEMLYEIYIKDNTIKDNGECSKQTPIK